MTTAGVWEAILMLAFAEQSRLFGDVMRQLQRAASCLAMDCGIVWAFRRSELRDDDQVGECGVSSNWTNQPRQILDHVIPSSTPRLSTSHSEGAFNDLKCQDDQFRMISLG